jgi:hypothetical protein
MSFLSPAQTDSTYIDTDELLEDVLQETDEDQDNSDLYEIMEQLLLNPIDINSSGISELQQIPDVDAETASLIYNYRKKYGNFFSLEELNAIRGLDKEIISKIKPFLTVNKKSEVTPVEEENASLFNNVFTKADVRFRSRISNDLQTRKAFTDNIYQGSKLKSYNRLLLKYDNNYQMGLLIEKDAGENDIDEFSSYHFAAKNFGIIDQIVLGDYLFEFGQGLALWSPYGFSKGADAIYPVKRRSTRIKPYTSSTENNFMRGAGGTINIYDFTFSAFYSKNKFDANIDPVTGDILSRPIDGFHRTASEISKRRTAEETILGSVIGYNYGGGIKAGLLYYRSKFSHNLLSSDVFDLEGNEFNFTSVYYDFLFQNINVFGEVAYNGISVASINSFSFYIGRDFSFVTSVRSYPRNYISLHGYAFGERSGAATNEFGIYTGIKWRTSLGILNFYYDQFKFPFAVYSNPSPGTGDEFLAEIINKLFNRVETKFRYKYEYKDITKSINETTKPVKRLKQLFRFEIVFDPVNTIRLKGRFDYSTYNVELPGDKEEGYSYLQDVRYSPNHNLHIYFRIIFYKTESFNSAVYEFENDLTGIFSNRALFGEGTRWYFILKYRPIEIITISLKYSETYKPGEEKIGSGLNEISGNVDNNLSFQLDLSF